ncbi:hypothetical protein FNFX1_0095 [Francisella cf. novicida Fx1]|nr:hypothetical protein FNFX1_0095 [Francisella cf. novicida Fx1]
MRKQLFSSQRFIGLEKTELADISKVKVTICFRFIIKKNLFILSQFYIPGL